MATCYKSDWQNVFVCAIYPTGYIFLTWPESEFVGCTLEVQIFANFSSIYSRVLIFANELLQYFVVLIFANTGQKSRKLLPLRYMHFTTVVHELCFMLCVGYFTEGEYLQKGLSLSNMFIFLTCSVLRVGQGF